MVSKVEEHMLLFWSDRRVCVVDLKWKDLLQVWNERVCDKGIFFLLCVCFFFSFCPKGQLKAVLIAQTHRQQVILYMPSVVPSFVYLLLNCLRRVLVCCVCVLNLRFFWGTGVGSWREMRELSSSFVAVSYKNFHGPMLPILDTQNSLPRRLATLSKKEKGFVSVASIRIIF